MFFYSIPMDLFCVCVFHKRAILLWEFSLNTWSHMCAGNPLLQNTVKSAKCAANP